MHSESITLSMDRAYKVKDIMQNPYPLPDCPGDLKSSFWVSLIKHFDFAIRIYQEEW